MVQRYFLILASGHTGSAWLAKVLNSHFEVMCFHELELMTYTLCWPPRLRAYFEFGPKERLRNLLYLFSPSHRYGDSFQALGSTAGTVLHLRRTMEEAAAYFPDAAPRARFFVVMRNPVSQIHSTMCGLTQMAKYVSAKKQMRDFHRKLSRQVLGKMEPSLARSLITELRRADPEVEYFLHACLLYMRTVWAAQEAQATFPYRSVFRLEDLGQDWSALQEALKQITGFEYDLVPQFTEKVNVQSGGRSPSTLFQSWSPECRRLFVQVFEPQRHALESLNYDLGKVIGCPGQFADSETANHTRVQGPHFLGTPYLRRVSLREAVNSEAKSPSDELNHPDAARLSSPLTSAMPDGSLKAS